MRTGIMKRDIHVLVLHKGQRVRLAERIDSQSPWDASPADGRWPNGLKLSASEIILIHDADVRLE